MDDIDMKQAYSPARACPYSILQTQFFMPLGFAKFVKNDSLKKEGDVLQKKGWGKVERRQREKRKDLDDKEKASEIRKNKRERGIEKEGKRNRRKGRLEGERRSKYMNSDKV